MNTDLQVLSITSVECPTFGFQKFFKLFIILAIRVFVAQTDFL